MGQPKLLQKPWGVNGLRNDVPTVRSNNLAQEASTYEEGFPSITMTPISVGGKPPSGKDMNGVLYDITDNISYLNRGGRFTFIRDFCTAIGGYPKGAVLSNNAGTAEYISLVDKNTDDFNTVASAKWALLSSTGKPRKITSDSKDEIDALGHSHSIDKASASVAGIVMLVNALNSTATDRALTAAQGKALADALGALGDEAFKQRGTLGSRNLDTLKGITNFGVWFMSANAGATTALNYPAARAGTLLVLPAALEGIQLYIPFEWAQIYIRNTTQSGAWSAWRIIGEVVNSLTSTSATAALSAAQGKVLNDKIEQAAPSGEVAYFAGRNAPAGWLKANGAAVSRTAYAALFAAIGTTYGPGNGSTTFNLPDLRGEFMRGWDDGRGIDLGRAFGSAQGDAIRNITGEAKFGYDGDTVYDPNAAASTSAIYYPDRKVQDQVNNMTLSSNAANNWRPLVFDASRAVPTADENRPRNIALLACIKI